MEFNLQVITDTLCSNIVISEKKDLNAPFYTFLWFSIRLQGQIVLHHTAMWGGQ